MAKIQRFEDLEAWKISRDLTKEIYRITTGEKFARDFGLRDQIRRATVSIMSNVAEGFERVSDERIYSIFIRCKGFLR